MEINAQPDRMDLSDANARLARERGVKLTISTDAHSVAQLDNLRFGVFVARRAGLGKDDVLNTLPYERFRKSIRKRGATAAPGTSAAAKAPAPKVNGKPARAATRANQASAPKARVAKPGPARAAKRSAPAKRTAPAKRARRRSP